MHLSSSTDSLSGSLALVLENSLQNTNGALASLHLLDDGVNAELLVGPQRLLLSFVGFANANEATLGSPLAGALDAELLPDSIKRLD